MPDEPVSLIDRIYRASFAPNTKPVYGWKNNTDMKHALERARRFSLDDNMSSFMADLANESFIKAGKHNPATIKIADSLRVSARLPYESIWIEYSLRAYQKRNNETRGTPLDYNEDAVPIREGWLIQQHPKIETAFIAHLFNWADDSETQKAVGRKLFTFPFAFAWCADDNPLPWRKTGLSERGLTDDRYWYPSAMLAGIAAYKRGNVNYVVSPLIEDPSMDPAFNEVHTSLLTEWAGVIRRMWALLATIDNLPVTKTAEARTSKGFLARGQIRKFLTRQTIKLNIPGRTSPRVLARQMIAHAHRRRHEVRAHWRDDWRNPPATQCNPHLWECFGDDTDTIQCTSCSGRQIFIHKHERGDAGVGYVLHDYELTHDDS